MDVTLVDMVPPGSAIRMPGFPEELRDVVPRADGQRGERNPTFFGPDWVREERKRELLLQSDLLFQFAQRVAGITGSALNKTWQGGADHAAATEMLITNAASRWGADGEPLPADKTNEILRDRAFEMADNTAMQQHMQRLGMTERDAALRSPEVRAEIERLVHAAERRPPEAPASKLPPAPPAAPPPSVLASTSMPAVGRPQARPGVRVVTPRALDAVESAQGEPKRTVDGNGNIVSGIDNKYVMLLRIMLNNPTEPALKAWRMLYEPQGIPGESTLEVEARFLRDLKSMHRLLHTGEGGLDWVRAPEHTGMIFFTPAFASAVAMAADDVRQLAGKPFATDIGLMTHESVRPMFAQLVAYYMDEPRSRNISRYGGTVRTLDERRSQHGKLIRAFRRMERDQKGILFVPRHGNQLNEAEQFRSGRPAVIAIDGSGREQRRAAEIAEREVMARTGRYFSDAY